MFGIKKVYIIFFLIICLGALFRFFKISEYPVQLGHDEITQLYDAISIAQTGRDIYGNFLPFIFESVHDFKPPFYTYATALVYFLFGNKEIIIRVPGLFFSLLLIPAVYLFTKALLKNNTIAVLAALFTAIAPFEVFFGRKSFENGAGIFLMLIGFYFLLLFRKEKVFLGAIFLGVAMYTYFSHVLIIPLLIVSFIIIFRKIIFSQRKQYFKGLSVFLLIIFPLLWLIALNPASRYRSSDVFITQDFQLGQQISNLQTGITLFDSIIRLKVTTDFSITRYLNQFDPKFIFVDGLDFTNQGFLDIGPLYIFQLPFLILGIIYLIRSDLLKEKKFIASWIILGMIPSGLTFEEHSPHRVIMVFTMLNIITAAGFWQFLNYAKKITNLLTKVVVYAGLSFAIFFNVIYFIHMYFVNYPFEKSQEIHYPFKDVALFARQEKDKYKQIVFDPLFGEAAPVIGTGAHYYLGYYGNFPPDKFQKEYRFGKREREVLFDKFSIRKFDWALDSNIKDTLFIASPWSLNEAAKNEVDILKSFYFYNGQLAFYAFKIR